MASAGLVWIMLVVMLAMPAVRGPHFDLASRYRHLGGDGDAAALAAGIISEPGHAVDHLASPETLSGVSRQVFTQGGVGMLAPAWLLAAAPIALLQWLSGHEPQRELRIQYGMQVLPLVSLATVEGLRRIEGRRTHNTRLLPLITVGLVVCTVLGALWFSPARALSRGSYISRSERAAIGELLARVPPEASVSAQSGLAPHLSQRREIYEFPNLNGARYVVLDLSGVVAEPYQATYAAEVVALGERGYELIWSRGGCRLYERMSR